MRGAWSKSRCMAWFIAASATLGWQMSSAPASESPGSPGANEPAMLAPRTVNSPVPSPTTTSDSSSLLTGEVQPIDLGTALRLAGVQNPDLMVARQLVVESVATRQLAAAQILPTLNGGGSYDTHTGNLQQSSGNILSVNRSSVYVGSGAYTAAAGPITIPGVVLTGNVAEGLFLYLVTRQIVRQREFGKVAVNNQVLLRVATDYCELIRAEAHRAIAEQIRDESAEVSRITGLYAKTGQGRQADADRAATELARRRADLRQAEGDILVASSRVCRTLNLDPSIRLHPTDAHAVPMTIVPDSVPLCELITIALLRRPELGERRAAFQESLFTLRGAKALPFSPTVLIGISGGGFGGGSNLVRPNFGNFGDRSDIDAFAVWSARNLGVGNLALIRIARSQVAVSKFRELAVLDQVRDEVAEAYARTHARFAQIEDEELAVRSSTQGFALDLERIKQGVPGEGRNPRPIEVLDSLNLLQQSKIDYLDAIVDYNQAHFQMYVALGQPPAANFAHAVPLESNASGENPPAGVLPPPPPSPSPFAPSGRVVSGR